MRPWNQERWQQNADGSYVRKVGESAPPEEVDATVGASELAEELGLDLAEIEGTGKDGRVTKADVEAAAE